MEPCDRIWCLATFDWWCGRSRRQREHVIIKKLSHRWRLSTMRGLLWGCCWLTTILDGLLSGNSILRCQMTVLLYSFPTTPPPPLPPCWFISRGNVGTVMAIWDLHFSGYHKIPIADWTMVCVQVAIAVWCLHWSTSPSCAASQAV